MKPLPLADTTTNHSAELALARLLTASQLEANIEPDPFGQSDFARSHKKIPVTTITIPIDSLQDASKTGAWVHALRSLRQCVGQRAMTVLHQYLDDEGSYVVAVVPVPDDSDSSFFATRMEIGNQLTIDSCAVKVVKPFDLGLHYGKWISTFGAYERGIPDFCSFLIDCDVVIRINTFVTVQGWATRESGFVVGE